MQSSRLLRLGLHSALRRAGIRQVRFHDLRHSVASNLLDAGIEPGEGVEGARPCERAHHAHDLCARDSEGAPGCGRRDGPVCVRVETKWKHWPESGIYLRQNVAQVGDNI
jgi:hypothetical protein